MLPSKILLRDFLQTARYCILFSFPPYLAISNLLNTSSPLLKLYPLKRWCWMRQTVALFQNKSRRTLSYILVGSTIRQTSLRKVLLLPICIMFLETFFLYRIIETKIFLIFFSFLKYLKYFYTITNKANFKVHLHLFT